MNTLVNTSVITLVNTLVNTPVGTPVNPLLSIAGPPVTTAAKGEHSS